MVDIDPASLSPTVPPASVEDKSVYKEIFKPVSHEVLQDLLWSLNCDSQTKVKICEIIEDANHNQKRLYTINLIEGMTITVRNGVVTKV